MRAPRIAPHLLAPALLTLTGCGYVHFGRLPPAAPAPVTIVGDAALMQENAGLRLEKQMLQRELALTRAQGEALRMAIQNRAADGDTSKQLVARLSETSRELATLRADYAKLKTERDQAVAGSGDAGTLKSRLGATEEKLAASLRNYTELQEEINRLRADLTRTRTENAALTTQVKTITADNEQAQAALAQLNTELLAQKQARHRAEQDAELFRTELKSVAPNSSVLAQQRTGAAGEARSLAEEHAAEAAALKRQLDLLREQVGALEAERSKWNQHATAVPANGSQGSRATSARPAESTPVTAEPERPAGEPTVVAEAARIDLGTDATPGGSSSVNATLVAPPGLSSRVAAARGEAAGQRTHVVAGGDTLAKISTQYYGTPARWGEILAANRDVLGEDNKLVVGRTLRIP